MGQSFPLTAWLKIDTDTNTWNIAGNRMKSGQPHRVPLSPEVMALLEALPRIEGETLIFPGAKKGNPLSDMTMTKAMRDMGVDAAPHGFRSTFSGWCACVHRVSVRGPRNGAGPRDRQ